MGLVDEDDENSISENKNDDDELFEKNNKDNYWDPPAELVENELNSQVEQSHPDGIHELNESNDLNMDHQVSQHDFNNKTLDNSNQDKTFVDKDIDVTAKDLNDVDTNKIEDDDVNNVNDIPSKDESVKNVSTPNPVSNTTSTTADINNSAPDSHDKNDNIGSNTIGIDQTSIISDENNGETKKTTNLDADGDVQMLDDTLESNDVDDSAQSQVTHDADKNFKNGQDIFIDLDREDVGIIDGKVLNDFQTSEFATAKTQTPKINKRPFEDIISKSNKSMETLVKRKKPIESDKVINNLNKFLKSPEKIKWLAAIYNELHELFQHHTFEEVLVDEKDIKNKNINIIPTTWRLNKKLNVDNSIKFKARLCARGDLESINENDNCYSPTLSSDVLRSSINYAIQNDLKLSQHDISNAFVSSPINNDNSFIYIPQFYHQFKKQDADHYETISIPEGKRLVLKLRKSLYGLRSSGRNFYYHLRDILINKLGLKADIEVPCVYKKFNENNELVGILLTFVDDLILFSKSDQVYQEIVEGLGKEVKLKTIDPVIQGNIQTRKILGIEIEEIFQNGERVSIKLHQKRYTEDLIKKFMNEDAKVKPSPPTEYIDNNSYKAEKDPDYDRKVNTVRQIMGSILFLSTNTRPDITFSINYATKFQLTPSNAVFNFLNRLLCYLKGTTEKGLIFSKKEEKDMQITTYVDASHSSDENFKSTFGIVSFMDGTPISWSSEGGSITTFSPAESEVIAFSNAVKNDLWLKRMIEFMTNQELSSTKIITDSTAAINMILSDDFNKKNRHLNIRLSYCRQFERDNYYNIQYIETRNQLADIMTKPLKRPQFEHLAKALVKN
ncbi:Transposon Ty1-A Gag-Pol polyprotein [Wickerhamomyces ciferrii]|uniref:Transposon Ty1-A Gag-Pol polyprotein n=1 Tax=Wickerhamomyces ciferrii (strain ATCC 14091 / BCRC 22168 / CBS 111 / JCM 3599 / NBRC 0793 / NRRL Y-1031 F-60-10) TaxID=1206466 RepID=K0L0S7_WICCF|nr:Transposon Ty1-A Gag-Pol polyprotein [Wickerhamomyces ciferrii]CCH47169.1 Transposon Ty1-A Gag-Pol polyprotein [Wickerhamomyces ciferrii]